MERLIAAMRRQADSLDRKSGQTRFGVVSSTDPTHGSVRVVLKPEDILTGWLPVLTSWCGGGWGIVCLPAPGDQVIIQPMEGDIENGVVIGRVFSDVHPPPAAPLGELWLVHSRGQAIKLKNDGTIVIEGDLIVNGAIRDNHGFLDSIRQSFNHHRHVDSRGGLTSPPDLQD